MNPKLFACFAFIGCLPFITTSPAQALPATSPETEQAALMPADSSFAEIVLKPTGDLWRITGTFANDEAPAGELGYELIVEREGAAGTSRSSQSGTFETRPGQTATLSTSRVNARPGDRLHIRLIISDGGATIAEDAVDKHIQ